MAKRGNESSQLSKEELAALNAQRSSSARVETFERATAEQMANRRIFRSPGLAAGSTTAATAADSSAAKSNPFAKFTFAASATTASTPAATSKSIFASSTTRSLIPTPAPPKTSVAATMMDTDASTTGTPADSMAVSPPAATANATEPSLSARIEVLSTAIRNNTTNLKVHGCEWTTPMLQSRAYRNALQEEAPTPTTTTATTATTKTTTGATEATGASVSHSTTTTKTTTAMKSSTSTPPALFSFGNNTSTTTPMSTATSNATATFSFPPPPATAAVTTTPAATTPAASAAPSTTVTNSSAAEEEPSMDDEPTSVQSNPDSDSIVHYQVPKARQYFIDRDTGNFVGGPKGQLKLEYSKAGKRIVIRDTQSGKIMFLVALPKEIKIVEQKRKSGLIVKFIEFFSEQGVNRLRVTDNKVLSELYEKIRELGEMKV